MNKKLVLIIGTLGFFSQTGNAFADETVDPCAGSNFNVLCNASPIHTLSGIITAVFVLALVLTLAYLIYGGIRWVLSQGDKVKVDAARSHIIQALVGMILIFLSYFLLNAISQMFFQQNLANITIIPTINLTGNTATGGVGTVNIVGSATPGTICNNPPNGQCNCTGGGATPKTCNNTQHCILIPAGPASPATLNCN